MHYKHFGVMLFLLIAVCSGTYADISQDKRSVGFAAVDNFGQQSTGEWRECIQYHLSDLMCTGDDLMLGFARSQQSWPNGGKICYSTPLNKHGVVLVGEYAQAGLDSSGNSPAQSYEKGITYTRCRATIPMADTSRKKVWGVVGLSQTRANRTFADGSNVGNNVNLLELSYNYNAKATRSQTNVSLSFAGNFRSNPTGSVDNAQPGRFDLNIKRQISITPKWQVVTRGLGVFSFDPLLDSQKLVLGGYSSVRGFAASEVNGDRGFLLSAESRHRINPKWQFYYYTDYGYTRAISTSVSNTLLSAGLGVCANLSSGSSVSLERAFPLNDHIVKDGHQNGRFWVSYVMPIDK